MVNASLEDTTSVTMSGNFDTVRCDSVVYELETHHEHTYVASLKKSNKECTWLSSGASLFKHF